MTKNDPSSGGKHHVLPLDWVDHMDQKVHPKKSSKDVTEHWRSAA